jgi:porin
MQIGPESTTPHIPLPMPHLQPGPIDFSAVYTSDIWTNVRGGLRRGTRYLDNLDLTAKLDADRAFGWRGATLFAYVLTNNGVGMSRSLVGNFQDSSNIETAVRAVRLYEAWYEQRFANDRASVKLGLFDLNSEFDVQETGALFLTASHGIGPDFSQSGQNGPSIFPVTSLAVRADYKLANGWLVRAAVLDGVPGDPEHPKRFVVVKLGHGDGALMVAEVEHEAGRTRAVLGYWRYTAKFDDMLASSRSGERVTGSGNQGVYMTIERRFVPAADQGKGGLRGWARLGFANDRFNPLNRYLGGGLVYSGPFKSRPDDEAGIALASAHFGGPYRDALALAGERTDATELQIEATYRAVVTRRLTLQPDVQYIVHPGGRPDLRVALLFGLRTQIGF